jgi:sugar O-acyltransferase (sialic acid O-acetyltransferase NeuD family)
MTAPMIFAVYGASGFGREVLPVAREMLQRTVGDGGWELLVVDDSFEGASVNGHRVLRYSDFLEADCASRHVCIAIADAPTRRKLASRCESDGIPFFSIIAHNALILDAVELGDGAIICPFVTLTSNIRIGRHFHANIYAYVAHDSVVGDFVTLAPGAKCNGNTRLEDDAYVGTGAILRQGALGAPLVIGSGATVGMGAVVTKSVPPRTTVVGNPARPLASG